MILKMVKDKFRPDDTLTQMVLKVGGCRIQLWLKKTVYTSSDSKIFEGARVYDNAEVYETSYVYGNARVYRDACVYGWSKVGGSVRVFGNANICEVEEVTKGYR